MVRFQIGCVPVRSLRSRVASQARRAWLSAVMARLTWRRRCWSVRSAPLPVEAIVASGRGRRELAGVRLNGQGVRVGMVLLPCAT